MVVALLAVVRLLLVRGVVVAHLSVNVQAHLMLGGNVALAFAVVQ